MGVLAGIPLLRREPRVAQADADARSFKLLQRKVADADALYEAAGAWREKLDSLTVEALSSLERGHAEDLQASVAGLHEIAQQLSEAGVDVSEEFQAGVRLALEKLADTSLEKLDGSLARHLGNAELSPQMQVVGRVLERVRTDRAMHGAGREYAERWSREHRDIGLQLKWLAKPMAGTRSLEATASLLPHLMSRDDTRAERYEREFGVHIDLLLGGWSAERLVCLQYNMRSLDEVNDAETALHLRIVESHLEKVMERYGIDEARPEAVMLRKADNRIDPSILADWIEAGRVTGQEVSDALNEWTSQTLEQIAELNVPSGSVEKYVAMKELARAILEERDAPGLQDVAGALPPPASSSAIRQSADEADSLPERAEVAVEARERTSRLVARYTTWGMRYSIGSLLNTTLRYATLSEPARRLGNWVQHGHASGAQYLAGAAIKGLASITGALAGTVAGVVTVAETVVARVLEGSARLVGGATLAIAGASAKLVGLASPAANRAGDRIVHTARDLVQGISLVSDKGRQQPIPLHMAARAASLASLARITGSSKPEVRAEPLPQGFLRATSHDIPRELLSREDGGTGQLAKLHFDADRGVLRSDRWSDLMIGVYVEEDAEGNGIAYHLSFVGTKASRPASFKSDVAQGFLGFEDSAYQDADAIVKSFVERYGAQRVKLQGHSLGGALAQWAGIRNSASAEAVQVTCFNAAGLHVSMRNRLGEDLIAKANIEHFNTERDFLSQRAEGARSPILGAQVGRRYVIPQSKGHSLENHIQALKGLPHSVATRHNLPVELVVNAATLPADAPPMKPLGRGDVTQVYEAWVTLPDGSPQLGVYKKDNDSAESVPNAALRNLATSKLDQRLGLNVITRTHLVVDPGGLGCVMEFAPGDAPVRLGNRRIDVTAEAARSIQNDLQLDPDYLNDFAMTDGFVGARLDGLILTLINERPVDPDDATLGMESLPSLTATNFEEDSDFWREATKLQWLDALTGQCDRHARNYHVWRDPQNRVRVTGIDNDLSFGENLLDPDERDPFDAPRLPRVIDVNTAAAFLALTPDQIEQDCAGLSPPEIDATKSRLAMIQARILSFDAPEADGQVTLPDAKWSTDPAIRELLGVVPFAVADEAFNPGRMMRDAAAVSYVAREWSSLAAFDAGYRHMAIFDPEGVAGWGDPEGRLLRA